MIRATLVLWLAVACSALGNILMRKGMQRMGPLEDYRPVHLARYLWRAVTDPHVLFGVVASAANFFLWLVVLSWADVSWALPMNAVEYLLVGAMAHHWLREKLDPRRWVGIGLITAGVALMMRSW